MQPLNNNSNGYSYNHNSSSELNISDHNKNNKRKLTSANPNPLQFSYPAVLATPQINMLSSSRQLHATSTPFNTAPQVEQIKQATQSVFPIVSNQIASTTSSANNKKAKISAIDSPLTRKKSENILDDMQLDIIKEAINRRQKNLKDNPNNLEEKVKLLEYKQKELLHCYEMKKIFLSKAEENNQTLKKELEKAKKKSAGLEKERTKLKEGFDSQLLYSQNNIQNLEKEIQENQNLINQQQQQISKSEQYKRDKEHIEQEMENLKSRLSSQKVNNKKAIDDYLIKENKFINEKHKYQQKIKELEQQLTTNAENQSKNQAKIEDLQQQCTGYSEDQKKDKKTIKELEQQLAKNTEEKKNTEEQQLKTNNGLLDLFGN